MSNPCINRWGLNSFWHHFWYSDTHYSLYVQQDKIIADLIQLYLKYGTVHSSVFYRSFFWYKTSNKSRPNVLNYYYRWVTTEETEHAEAHTSRLRLESAEAFYTRVSVLRFDSWLIVNLYWFQPDKLKNKRAKRSTIQRTPLSILRSTPTFVSLAKINTITRNALLNKVNNQTNYSF